MENHKARIWNKDFAILFLVSIVTSLGFQMLNPNMAEYAAALGVGVSMLGTVTSMFAFAALVARPFAGKAADTMDNKTLIIISLSGITLSLLLYTFAHSFALMLAARFIHGLFFGLNSTLAMSMASRTLPDSKMGSGMGVFGIGMIGSMTVAPTLGIYIVEGFGYNWLFYSAAAITGIAFILVIFLKKQPIPKPPEGQGKIPFWKTFFAPEAISPSTIAMFNACAFGVINTFLVLLGKERGIANIGVFFTVNALALLLLRLVISKYIDRIPPKLILYPCSACMIASLLLIATARSLTPLLVAAALFGFGNGGAQPALQTLCLRCVGFERRGASSGTYYIGMDIGNMVGPVVAGVVAASGGYGNAYAVMAAFVMMGVVVTFFSFRKKAVSPNTQKPGFAE